MSLKNVDIESAMRRLADKRIEEAMREGKFDNLAGKGKPLDLEPMPAEENARLTWWAIRLMRNADVTPDEVRLRKRVDTLRDELAVAKTEQRVTYLVTAINSTVRHLNTLGTNAINQPVAPVSLEAEQRRFRDRVAPAAAAGPPAGAEAPPPPPAPGPRPAGGIRHCTHKDCKSRNAAGARFCRVCGRKLVAKG
jgi:hypothetical protein